MALAADRSPAYGPDARRADVGHDPGTRRSPWPRCRLAITADCFRLLHLALLNVFCGREFFCVDF
jgi:hypothetical protein